MNNKLLYSIFHFVVRNIISFYNFMKFYWYIKMIIPPVIFLCYNLFYWLLIKQKGKLRLYTMVKTLWYLSALESNDCHCWEVTISIKKKLRTKSVILPDSIEILPTNFALRMLPCQRNKEMIYVSFFWTPYHVFFIWVLKTQYIR